MNTEDEEYQKKLDVYIDEESARAIRVIHDQGNLFDKAIVALPALLLAGISALKGSGPVAVTGFLTAAIILSVVSLMLTLVSYLVSIKEHRDYLDELRAERNGGEETDDECANNQKRFRLAQFFSFAASLICVSIHLIII